MAVDVLPCLCGETPKVREIDHLGPLFGRMRYRLEIRCCRLLEPCRVDFVETGWIRPRFQRELIEFWNKRRMDADGAKRPEPASGEGT